MKVVVRDELSSLNSVEIDGVVHDLGVVKIFSENADLAGFIPPSSNLAVSWVRLEGGQELAVHQHPEVSLIVICEGTGQTMGEIEQDVRAGDVILVPSNCRHGFRGVGEGYWALSIQFNGKALYEDTAHPNVVFDNPETTTTCPDHSEALLVANERYAQTFSTSRLPAVFDDPIIEQPEVRERLLDCVQTFSDAFQDLLHLRVAMTTATDHKKVAVEHLLEELGHNTNLRDQRGSSHRSPVYDEVFESSIDWFRRQMLDTSDMARTLLMHLVLEASGEIVHRAAARVFLDIPHFAEHGEDDGDHVIMGIDLLKPATPTDVAELSALLDEGWTMITVMCDRIAAIATSPHQTGGDPPATAC